MKQIPVCCKWIRGEEFLPFLHVSTNQNDASSFLLGHYHLSEVIATSPLLWPIKARSDPELVRMQHEVHRRMWLVQWYHVPLRIGDAAWGTSRTWLVQSCLLESSCITPRTQHTWCPLTNQEQCSYSIISFSSIGLVLLVMFSYFFFVLVESVRRLFFYTRGVLWPIRSSAVAVSFPSARLVLSCSWCFRVFFSFLLNLWGDYFFVLVVSKFQLLMHDETLVYG